MLLQFIITTDINECDDNDSGCSQICKNTEGSYECSCNDGYELDDNGRNCSNASKSTMCSEICGNTAEGSLF